jgi:hypothetical protein
MKDIAPFLAGLKARLNEYKTRMGFTYFQGYDVRVETGRRYHKVYSVEIPDGTGDNHRSNVVAFIDKETGGIYKPATFMSPAKHVRGYVDSPEHGMEAIGPDGFVYYLR